ncbi:hypothetical protein PQQ51_20255 [Paraburkholderia xenovorans]|uniref:hypothetical protein n=1 Tax=Paraburkholderia xenovorans TaxID=36873 RepID=UPI0038B87B80
MTEPSVKKPSKKAFHFPKSADSAAEPVVEAAEPVVSAVSAGKKKKDATAKTGAKTAARTAQKATAKTAAKSRAPAATEATPAKAPAEAKAKRARKEKVVRDSFTMPKSDYDKIAALKQKCLAAGVSVKKSEILRAGLLLLESAAPKRLLAAVSAVEQVKTGRPSQS